jgi:hypothetical protein
MWVFTEVADWFDKTRGDTDAIVDQNLQPWVASTLYEDHSWYRNAGVYFAAGTLYALNKFTTTVASGFVDVLRVGDGFKEGGWGYGKDALRLLMFVGPAFRGARYGLSLVKSVDIGGPICTWVAAARLLRLTGGWFKVSTKLSDVARNAGIGVEATGRIWPRELVPTLRLMGSNAKEVDLLAESGWSTVNLFGKGAATTDKALRQVVSANPNGAVMFSVRWTTAAGESVGHTMVAFRDALGRFAILDRVGGSAVRSLAKLTGRYGAEFATATVDGAAVVVQDGIAVQSLNTVPTLLEIITHALNPQSAPPASHSSPSAWGSQPGYGSSPGQGGDGSSPGQPGVGSSPGQPGNGSSPGRVVWLGRVPGLVLVDLKSSWPTALTALEILQDVKAVEPSATMQQVMASLQDLQARGAVRNLAGQYLLLPGFSPTFGQPKKP